MCARGGRHKAWADTLLMVGVSWCGHCRTTKPEFDSFRMRHAHDVPGLRVKYVDAEKEKDIATAFGVTGYPYIAYVNKRGQAFELAGPRTADTMLALVRQHNE